MLLDILIKQIASATGPSHKDTHMKKKVAAFYFTIFTYNMMMMIQHIFILIIYISPFLLTSVNGYTCSAGKGGVGDILTSGECNTVLFYTYLEFPYTFIVYYKKIKKTWIRKRRLNCMDLCTVNTNLSIGIGRSLKCFVKYSFAVVCWRLLLERRFKL